MANDPDVTKEYVGQFVRYDSTTGHFYRVRRTSNSAPVGARAEVQCKGHLVVRFNGHKVYAHRLAWFLVYGVWPDGQLDHKDGDGTNNRVDNLRVATVSQNQCNNRLRHTSKSGVKGVSWDSGRNKWAVKVQLGGWTYHGGRFDHLAQAVAAADNLRRQLHGKFYRAK